MIYMIETMMPGEVHLMVNSSLMRILGKKDQVTFVGDKLQAEKIKPLVQPGTRYRNIRVQGNPKLYFLPFIVLYHICIILFYLAKCKRGRDMVVISCIFPVTQMLLLRLKKIFFPRTLLIVTLHGELEFIKYPAKPILAKLGTYLKKALASGNNNRTIRYLVYGESIKTNVLRENWLDNSSLVAVDHPYNYDNPLLPSQSKPGRCIVGTIGGASVQKNAHRIFDLAQKTKALQTANEIVFKIVGSFKEDMRPYINGLVTFNDNNGAVLPRKEYEKELATLDYVLFFYDQDQYRFTASGAFFDCIKYGRPVLTLKNTFIDYYFGLLTNIGRQFENLEDMARFLQQPFNREEYELQCANIKAAREKLSVDQIADDFWNRLWETGIEPLNCPV